MKGAAALIRLGTYEVETLQKRLAEVGVRRAMSEMRIASLDAEAEVEAAHARQYAEAGIYMAGFREGWRQRRERVFADLNGVTLEEQGAREALNRAFESLKKVEHVAAIAAAADAREAAKRESAQLDELALRRAVNG